MVRNDEGGPYLIVMLVLSVAALGVLASTALIPLEREAVRILEFADAFLCVVFFLDFVVSLVTAPDRPRYLLTWGWLDLLSTVPTVGVLRVGRLGRLFRIFRVLRAIRAARILAAVFVRKRRQSAVSAAALISLLVIVVGGVAVIEFEAGAGGNIESAGDALWWTITTITTVGYGDKYPVTTEGRIVAAFLMIIGIGLFGTFSGLVASVFVAQTPPHEDEFAPLRQELAEIRRILTDMHRSGAG